MVDLVQQPVTALVTVKSRKVSNYRKVAKSELIRSIAKIEYLVEQEYVALTNAMDNPEHKLLMRLLWETGMRITEALGLTYADIYPDGVNIVGKGKKQRFIPCQAQVLGELLRYRETHHEQRIFKRITTEPGALYMMRRAAKKAEIPKRVHPHLFRHSFAINFIQQTGNPFALQDIGGWSDMETIKIYMRLAKEAPKQAIQRMYFPEVH
jgi:integrase